VLTVTPRRRLARIEAQLRAHGKNLSGLTVTTGDILGALIEAGEILRALRLVPRRRRKRRTR
jgi:hypothetical protein